MFSERLEWPAEDRKRKEKKRKREKEENFTTADHSTSSLGQGTTADGCA